MPTSLAYSVFRRSVAIASCEPITAMINGMARAARSRPETRDIRLIAITGYGQAKDRQKAVDAGFDLHLAKPVDPTALQELLARL